MRALMRLRMAITAGLVLSLAVLAGCGNGEDTAQESGANRLDTAPRGAFVGSVQGSDAYIGLISNGDEVAGYVCSNGEVSSWLAGSELDDGAAELVNRDGDALGRVTLTTDDASGEVEVDGTSHEFAAEPAAGDAGLYRATAGKPRKPGFVEAGWVLLGDGSQRGSANIIDPDGDFVVAAAPTLDPDGQREIISLRKEPLAAKRLSTGFVGDHR
ncbi:MAG: hypothetical protein ACRDLO_07625 [Solirubrobacterales bacterium]